MNTQKGSSLIGVAILTLVMGFLMSGGIYLLKTFDAIKEDEESRQTVVSIQEALNNHTDIHKKYPCPAHIDLAPDEPGFGLADCSIMPVSGRDGLVVLIGTVPVRTLNVPDQMMLDGFGKRHIYAVTESLTDSATADVKNGLGAITIIHKGETMEESLSRDEGFITYALLSPGEDDRGAYDMQGKQILPCDATSLAGENCDMDDATFFTTVKTSIGNSTDFTHSFAFKASTLAHNWYNEGWSECGRNLNGAEWANNPHPRPTCFSSYQERNVECRDKQGNTAESEASCEHTEKPATERVCSLGPCRWRTIPASCR